VAPTVIKEELKNMDPMDLEHNFDVIPPTPLKHGGLYILIPLLFDLDVNVKCFEKKYLKNISEKIIIKIDQGND
tara:strand:+ start:222 stop:443 length:222 start_codon:yes stop_codon:yes gene_type:complete